MKTIRILFLLLFTTSLLQAQELNQMDANGQRHGQWKKYFESTKVVKLKFVGEEYQVWKRGR